MALPQIHRLTDRAQIARILRSGKRSSVAGMRVTMIRSFTPYSHLTVIVPKSVDKRSTVRNALRRRVTESMRPMLPRFLFPVDAVITLEKDVAQLSVPEFKAHLLDLFKKLPRNL